MVLFFGPFIYIFIYKVLYGEFTLLSGPDPLSDFLTKIASIQEPFVLRHSVEDGDTRTSGPDSSGGSGTVDSQTPCHRPSTFYHHHGLYFSVGDETTRFTPKTGRSNHSNRNGPPTNLNVLETGVR